VRSADWSKEKGIADEAHFNEFVVEVQAELIAPLIERQGVKNADYLFRAAKVIGEHKILETDFAQSPNMLARVDMIFAKYTGDDLTDRKHPLFRDLFGLLRIPLKRIIEKANQQIKETKLELGLKDHRGLIFLVNDDFRSAPPRLVRDLIRSILREKERYRSVDGVVYITNHYVEISESPMASLIWSPIYKGHPSGRLIDFVDWLGGRWSAFLEARIGPFENNMKIGDINWDRAYVVTGPRRVERYEGED
jgi:hypothetical protein